MPSEFPYDDALPKFNARVKGGEFPSIFDFLPEQLRPGVRDQTITTDVTEWMQKGIDSVAGAGGGNFHIPFGLYPLKDLDVRAGVTLVGAGLGKTILKRNGTLPDGRALVNFTGSRAGLRDLTIDGDVTTPEGITYAEAADPMNVRFTRNSSIWIPAGAHDIDLDHFCVRHTGGRAIMLDARAGFIDRVMVGNAHFENNRPFVAGPDSGSMINGSPISVIHMQADGLGANFGVRGLTVYACNFRRGTGNQLHGHLYGFGTLHSDLRVLGCYFEDIGRDGVLVGGTVNVVVNGCTFRRIGYVCTDDTSPGVPRWVSNQWAVGIDTAGLVRNAVYSDNTFINNLGACMDGDGLANAIVADNNCRVSLPGEPEYEQDNVAAWPGNYCYGVQVGNSNNIPDAAKNLNIIGNNFFNLGLGAVRGYAMRSSNITGNVIFHPPTAAVNPIRLGTAGTGPNQRAYDNTVAGNTIHWAPATHAPAIFEDASLGAFEATDKNWIAGNHIWGDTCYEFMKDVNTSSITAVVFSSNRAGLASTDAIIMQREYDEVHNVGYFRIYRNSDTFGTIIDSFPVAVGVSGPIFNLSLNAVGGVFATGPRTSSRLGDAMLTGKLFADGFMVLTNTTFSDPEADSFDADFGLMRFDKTAAKFQVSRLVDSGTGKRIWEDLGSGGSGGGGVAGPSGAIQYNWAGNHAGSLDLMFDQEAQRMTINGVPGTAGLLVQNSYIQSQGGFFTPLGDSRAVYAPSGGVTALSLISERDDGENNLTMKRASAVAAQYGLRILTDGSFALHDDTNGAVRMKMLPNGTFQFGIGTPGMVSIDQSGNLSATNQVVGLGVRATGDQYNALQAPAGGIYAGLGVTADQALYLKSHGASSTLNNPAAGYGGLAHKGGTEFWLWNGAAWTTINLATVGGGVTSITGTANQVIVSGATGAVVLSTPQDIHTGASPTFATLTASSTASNSIQTAGGVLASGGFAVPAGVGNTDAIQALGGGVTVKYLIGTSSMTLAADAAAGLTSAGQARLRFDGTNLQLSVNGGAYQNFTTGSGVTSITGTANQVIASSATGAVTLSLPQNIHTSAVPRFDSLNLADILTLDNTAGDVWNAFRFDAYANTLYICGNSGAASNAGTGIMFRTAPAGGGEVDRVFIDPYGRLLVNHNSAFYSQSKFEVAGASYLAAELSDQYPLILRGASGQTSALTRWTDFNGAVLADMSADGVMYAKLLSAHAYDTAPASTTHGFYARRQIRFRQNAGDEGYAGMIDYRIINPGALSIVGAGTALDRSIFLWDRVTITGYGVGDTMSHSDGTLTVNGKAYVAGGQDYICFFRYVDNGPGIQTCLDGVTLTAYQTPPVYGSIFNRMFLQPYAGCVIIGANYRESKFTIDHNVPDQIALMVWGAPGQTANLQEWRRNDGAQLAVLTNIGDFYGRAIVSQGVDSGSSSTTFGYMTARQLRFRLQAGDDDAAGCLDYRGYDTSALGIIGAGNAPDRKIRIWDRVYISGGVSGNSLVVENGGVHFGGLLSIDAISTRNAAANSIYSAGGVTAAGILQSNVSGATVGLQVGSGLVAYGNGNLNSSGNINTSGNFQINGLTAISSTGIHIGNGADFRGGVQATGFNIINSSGVLQGNGQTWNIVFATAFSVYNGDSGQLIGSFTQLRFKGGILYTVA